MPGLIVDNFAGGGGASVGIEMALGRSIDIAVNHDPRAVAMHKLNHPNTRHFCEDVWTVDPLEATKGKPVDLAWFSPDCTHFSKARGSKPVKKNIRGLAWVVLKWAVLTRPTEIYLENVEEFQDWGPVNDDNMPCPDRRGETFDAFKRALSSGVPKSHPAWSEIKSHLQAEGNKYSDKIINAITKGLGYDVEFKPLKASDYGAPTIRKRLFMAARCDGQPIVWPDQSHGKKGSGLLPERTAAECIDWSIPCPSIFERKRPLAEKTMKRIAMGLKRFVIDAEEPFIVKVNHGDDMRFRGQSVSEPIDTLTSKNGFGLITPYVSTYYGAKSDNDGRGASLDEPLRTQTTENRHALITPYVNRTFGEGVGRRADGPLPTTTSGGMGKSQLVTPYISRIGQTGGKGIYSNDARDPLTTVTSKNEHLLISPSIVGVGGRAGQSRPRGVDEPMATTTAKADTAIVEAFLAKHFGGVVGVEVDKPLPTILSRATQTQIVTSHMLKLRGTCRHGQPIDEPAPTITATGQHIAEVRAFLMKYYSSGGQWASVKDPMHTITSKERLGLVTVQGEDYQIADIGMRMLDPKELYRAQGFPETYQIKPMFNGKYITKTDQVRMVGNSVSPHPACALIRANRPAGQAVAA